eukprot:jgi/Tetstr1/461917/TSEL_006995.t1
MHVPSQGGVIELPELLVGDDDVATMAKVWAPFFECAHISENTSFNAVGSPKFVYPHLYGKLARFPIELFPLTTKSACFMEGNLPQTLRHVGFSETVANKIASALDMMPTKVFSHIVASGVRKLWVRALLAMSTSTRTPTASAHSKTPMAAKEPGRGHLGNMPWSPPSSWSARARL